jgi:hypothetical protein
MSWPFVLLTGAVCLWLVLELAGRTHVTIFAKPHPGHTGPFWTLQLGNICIGHVQTILDSTYQDEAGATVPVMKTVRSITFTINYMERVEVCQKNEPSQ